MYLNKLQMIIIKNLCVIINLWWIMDLKEIIINNNKLKQIRLEKGYTQEKIASILNISQSQYSYYENNPLSIPVEKLVLLAKFYDVSADYVLGLIDIKNRLP